MAGSVSADTSPPWRALAQVPLLAMVDEDRLRALWDMSVPRNVPAAQVIRHAGDPATHLLILLRGRVTAVVSAATGKVVRLGTWAGPCALDKVAVIDGGGHTATLTALSGCRLRSVPRGAFLALVDDVTAVRRHVLGVLAGRARRQQELFTASATLSAESRLAAWLLGSAAEAATRCVALPGTQQDLADELGVSRVTVNRALARLRDEGLIEVGRRSVRLLGPELLQLRASGVAAGPGRGAEEPRRHPEDDR